MERLTARVLARMSPTNAGPDPRFRMAEEPEPWEAGLTLRRDSEELRERAPAKWRPTTRKQLSAQADLRIRVM